MFEPDYAIAPGETIADEIRARGFHTHNFYEFMSMTLEEYFDLILGTTRIDIVLACKLKHFFDISIQTWLNLDKGYRKTLVRIGNSKK